MSTRTNTTQNLSDLVKKRLRSRRMFWASEVSFDKGTTNERRVDFVAFKPFNPNDQVEPTSVELGSFECYEVKSCMADFKSGHGLTFYGDKNFLVTTQEFVEELGMKMLIPFEIDAILVPNKSWTALISRDGRDPSGRTHQCGSQSYRKRIASEMLWQIVRANHHDNTGMEISQ